MAIRPGELVLLLSTIACAGRETADPAPLDLETYEVLDAPPKDSVFSHLEYMAPELTPCATLIADGVTQIDVDLQVEVDAGGTITAAEPVLSPDFTVDPPPALRRCVAVGVRSWALPPPPAPASVLATFRLRRDPPGVGLVGRLPPHEIRAVLDDVQERGLECLRRRHPDRDAVASAVRVSFWIDPFGSVTHVRTLEGTADRQDRVCLLSALRSAAFPPPRGGGRIPVTDVSLGMVMRLPGDPAKGPSRVLAPVSPPDPPVNPWANQPR